MNIVGHNGKSYRVDEDGFLINHKDWDENWVDYVMQVEGINKLTDEHRKAIESLRAYYKERGVSPLAKFMRDTTGLKLQTIYELFPSGPGKGACKMAGIPKPVSC